MRTYAEDMALTGLTAREFLRHRFSRCCTDTVKPVISEFSH